MTIRPNRSDPDSVRDATWAVHGGNAPDPGTGALRTPLVMANSYVLPEDPSTIDWSDTEGLVYTRNGGVNQIALERKLAAMEGGEAAAVFASGVAALHAVFFTLLKSGDHVVVSDVGYEAVWRLFSELLPERYGIEATFVDVSDPAAVRAALRPETRMIHVETIANPTTQVADIRGLADIAHEVGAIFTVDSTFTPPPFYRPLYDGADLVIHSLTKYINGHGDALGGAVIGDAETVGDKVFAMLRSSGPSMSPFNAWVFLKALETLEVRMQAHCQRAQTLAEWLEAQPGIERVYYPGLPSHPQFELAQRQQSGFGGIVSFDVAGGREAAFRLINSTQMHSITANLGDTRSTIVHPATTTHSRITAQERTRAGIGEGLIRVSVGLENIEDIIADLAPGLPGR
jgi:methionine-gamma-lyase